MKPVRFADNPPNWKWDFIMERLMSATRLRWRFSVATFLAWYVVFGFSIEDGDHRLFWWLGINSVLMILLQPILMRMSRSMWLSWFVKYDPDWETHEIKEEVTERVIKEQMNNW